MHALPVLAIGTTDHKPPVSVTTQAIPTFQAVTQQRCCVQGLSLLVAYTGKG